MDFTKIKNCGIVPVIKIDDAENAVPLANALLEGGVNVIEITFRTAVAKQAIANIASKTPDMFVGAGTILTVDQLKEAKEAGAGFLVSPGLNTTVVKSAIDENLPILPGIVTPTEICSGLELGINVFKFFPAENYGGLSTIKALSAPFKDIMFVPTGGINEKNAGDYWRFDKILAVGGSWMAPEKLINEQNFDEITRRTKEAVSLMKTFR